MLRRFRRSTWLLLALLPGLARAQGSVHTDSGQAESGEQTVSSERRKDILAGALPKNPAELAFLEASIQAVYERGKRATVTLGGAAGVLIEGGYVLTAGHVIDRPGRRVTLRTHDGSQLRGTTLGGSEVTDTGLVKLTTDEVPASCEVLKMRDSKELARGAHVVMLGFPGSRSSEGPPLRFGRILRNPTKGYLDSDCRMCSGDSGGPLLDLLGNVVGINSRITRDLAKNMHVSSATFLAEWDKLVASVWQGNPDVGFLGVEARGEARGSRILRVVPGSAAEGAGLQAADLILNLDGRSLAGFTELPDLLRRFKPGRRIRLTVERGSGDRGAADEDAETLDFTVRLGTRPPQ